MDFNETRTKSKSEEFVVISKELKRNSVENLEGFIFLFFIFEEENEV